MQVYRITSCGFISDLSGKGAAMHGGRWNNKNTYIVYTAESRALALLEAVVHMGKVPSQKYCMATIDIPQDSVQTFPLDKLPNDYFANPSPDSLKVIGDFFVQANRHLALRIPSVVMPEESNILINPAHKDFALVHIISQRPVTIDDRLFSK